jgi:uncharacterized protein YgbK (DUF1537 family)
VQSRKPTIEDLAAELERSIVQFNRITFWVVVGGLVSMVVLGALWYGGF